MPPSAAKMPTASATSYGQVIEYVQDRLYLASYTRAPNESTPFPYPSPTTRSPHKRSSKSQAGPTPVSSGPRVNPPVYFSVDETLLYNRFHADFGPLHIGHLYRFAVQLHEVVGDPDNAERGIVFWSKAGARSRANAACLLACYMILIQSWSPHLALAPIAQADPPLMPFRDAGYSQADYGICVQDVVYGVWKAKEEGLCGLKDFSLEEYETFERVDMGDFNWITPQFLAFASPQHKPVAPLSPDSPQFASLPKDIKSIQASHLPIPFKNILSHFKERGIGLVVRLNSELYCPSYFTALGINHIDMIFADGTCPPLPLVRKFIKLAHDMITQKKGIAVHCKAGLGRTGCLIGAYLIYRHGFTANEIISFMRFMRPGMVVGPQQHWLHLNQGTFREWWWEDTMKERLALLMPSTPTKTTTSTSPSRTRTFTNTQTATPPNNSQSSKRAALGEITHNETSIPPTTTVTTAMEECLPAPTPGQPRKTSRMNSPIRSFGARAQSASYAIREDDPAPAHEIVEMRSHRRSQAQGESESEEEWQLRMLSRRTSSPRSPQGSEKKKRAVSYTTTTTTTRYSHLGGGGGGGAEEEEEELGMGGMSDVENWGPLGGAGGVEGEERRVVGKSGNGSGGGALGVAKMRASPRRSAESREKAGVRKTSGRVGSVGAAAAAVGGRSKG